MTERPAIRPPQPDDLDLAFYEATARHGRLAIQQCRDCGRRTHPARLYCPSCASGEFEFVPVSGKATVHSWTVSHLSTESAWKNRVPYTVIVAELEEGPRVLAGTTDIAREELRLGLPIRLEVDVFSPDFSFVWASKA